MAKKIKVLAVAEAAAIISAAWMLVLGVLGKLGLYTNGVEQMMKWHVFFSLSWGGIILGMLEGAVFSFAIVYLFAWVYGKLS